MADLIDRIAYQDDVTQRPKINLHHFMGAERLYAFGEWTRSQIATAFDLQGSEAIQAGQIADKIDSEVGASNKALYVLRCESVFMCVETHDDILYHSAGIVNKTKVYEDLQITG